MGKIVVALGFLVAATAGGQTISWTRQFGTTADDSATALTSGADGSIYVAGITGGALEGSNSGCRDAFLRKYDVDGNVVWTRQFGTAADDGAFALTTGPDGGIYVAGYTLGTLCGSAAGPQAIMRKYDADGNVLWIRQFGAGPVDYAEALTAGPGGIYVAGQTWGPLGGIFFGVIDAYLRKYDADGNIVWTQQIGTAGDDDTRGVTAGPDGSIYVSGWTTGALEGSNAGDFDAILRKYDADGNVLWTRQFGTAGNDYAYPLTAGPDGIYVAGYTNGSLDGSSAGGYDAFVRKYGADGTVLWARQFGTAGNDYANGGITAGPDGIYVAGYTEGSLGGSNAGGLDAFLRKYDFNGNILWTRQFGTAGEDVAYALTAGLGGIYVAGETTGALGGSNAGGVDAFVIQIMPDETPPVISGLPSAGCILWPPNHKLVQVATVTALDADPGIAPGSFKVTGTSNEPSNDPKNPDIVITPNGLGSYVVQLRADRLGSGTGRVYTLTATASDLAGNVATEQATCSVPHDQGH